MNFKKIFITGGAGYVGSCLVPLLLKKNYKVTVYDVMFFGDNFLPKNNPNLKIIKGDIRDSEHLSVSCKNHDVFVNLACISNDTSFALNENLSTSINYDAFEPMVLSAKSAGIKRFIYASTSSVYGISDQKNVKEDHPLVPLTLYNKYKGMCEPLLLKHTDNNFEGVIFRPATVCGYSARQRFDLSVNILTNHAVNNKKILVFGGDQLRPNLHIDDYSDVVSILIDAESKSIKNEIFNVGHQNMSILDLANLVKKEVQSFFPEFGEIPIAREKSNDNRSYHINSDKIKDVLGFSPKRSVNQAVIDLCNAFKKNLFSNTMNDDIFYNVKRLTKLEVK